MGSHWTLYFFRRNFFEGVERENKDFKNVKKYENLITKMLNVIIKRMGS